VDTEFFYTILCFHAEIAHLSRPRTCAPFQEEPPENYFKLRESDLREVVFFQTVLERVAFFSLAEVFKVLQLFSTFVQRKLML